MIKKLSCCRATASIKAKQTFESYDARLTQEMDITSILKKLRTVDLLAHIVLQKKNFPLF